MCGEDGYLLPSVTFAPEVSRRLGAVHAAASGPRPASDGAGGGLGHGCERLPTHIMNSYEFYVSIHTVNSSEFQITK